MAEQVIRKPPIIYNLILVAQKKQLLSSLLKKKKIQLPWRIYAKAIFIEDGNKSDPRPAKQSLSVEVEFINVQKPNGTLFQSFVQEIKNE